MTSVHLGLLTGIIVLPLAYLGMGLPNHPYQVALAAAAVLVAIHQGWFLARSRGLLALTAIVNVAQLSFLLKLFIGTGVRHPFFWANLPTLAQRAAEGKLSFLPTLALTWEPTALAEWTIDFTLLQTFLVLFTLIGAIFRFQPFASLTAFVLILISIPALYGFNWQYVFPATLLAATSLYLQTTRGKLSAEA